MRVREGIVATVLRVVAFLVRVVALLVREVAALVRRVQVPVRAVVVVRVVASAPRTRCVLAVARCELLRFVWQAQDCVLVARVFPWQAQYLVTPGVGVGESVLSGRCGRFGRRGPCSPAVCCLTGSQTADLGWGAQRSLRLRGGS